MPDAMADIFLIAAALRADSYDRLDELTHHLRSGGVLRAGSPAMTNPQAVAPEDAHYLADSLVRGMIANIHQRPNRRSGTFCPP